MVRRLLRTRPGSHLFVILYDVYKDRIEATGNWALASRIPPGSWVVDVGANIGFFTERFANWVEGEGRVIAIELTLRMSHSLSGALRQNILPGWWSMRRRLPTKKALSIRTLILSIPAIIGLRRAESALPLRE